MAADPKILIVFQIQKQITEAEMNPDEYVSCSIR